MAPRSKELTRPRLHGRASLVRRVGLSACTDDGQLQRTACQGRCHAAATIETTLKWTSASRVDQDHRTYDLRAWKAVGPAGDPHTAGVVMTRRLRLTKLAAADRIDSLGRTSGADPVMRAEGPDAGQARVLASQARPVSGWGRGHTGRRAGAVVRAVGGRVRAAAAAATVARWPRPGRLAGRGARGRRGPGGRVPVVELDGQPGRRASGTGHAGLESEFEDFTCASSTAGARPPGSTWGASATTSPSTRTRRRRTARTMPTSVGTPLPSVRH
jgi:hypothetical protein